MYLLSLIFFIWGIIIIVTKELSNNRGIKVDLSDNYLYLIIGLSLIIFALYILYIDYKREKNKEKEKVSKCPKCKEVFNYNELKEGKCKYCKDIDTIDIEDYYKQYNDELECDKKGKN